MSGGQEGVSVSVTAFNILSTGSCSFMTSHKIIKTLAALDETFIMSIKLNISEQTY